MNIQELDAYNLDDAVKFNDRLNPRLWDRTEHLRPEVRKRLLQIAEDFKESLGIKDLDLRDITISGSNAAYTYTDNSDIDLHLVVDMPEDAVYRELFDAKKFQYNEQHDIKIGGYDVELYVQDAAQPHISQGIYSILNNEWIQVPRRARADVDDASTRNKFETIGHQIERAIASGSVKRMTRMAEKIKKMRQTGLEQHGEFGPENLAFKVLRSQGKIKELYDARNEAKSQSLSLKEQPAQKKFTWGFQSEGSAGIIPVGLNPDGTNSTTRMIVSDVNERPSDEEILKDFIDFCVKELKIEEIPQIKLRKDPQWPVVNKTFGRYRDDRRQLEVAWGQRHIMDVLRTVAHELTHKHQHEREAVPITAGETGSEYENEANARAGILMRDYARLYPDYFEAGQAEDLHIDEGLKSGAAAAAIVAALSGSAPAQAQVQDIIGAVRDIGNLSIAAKKITRAGLNAEAQQELNNYLSVSGDRNSRNLSVVYQLQRRLEQQEEQPTGEPLPGYTQQAVPPTNESASGYIPTKRQAKDPRFSTALTVDIKPGQLGKEANKLKLRTNKQGEPQQLRANGLFEELKLQLEAFKRAREDYSPDAPPGPETKPTMPRGTVRVDVSDMYDWYKLGKNMSNLKAADKSQFGKGPPSTIVSFGDEETEHKYIKDLENLGLDTTDIDPIDLKQPPGMKRQKTDPTYNVNEAEELDEVRMAPSNLRQFADSEAAEGIQAGFEAELIFRDTTSDEDDGGGDMEPDYDADERCRSLSQIVDFFDGGEYGYFGPRQRRDLEEKLDEMYYEWHDEQMYAEWRDEQDEKVREVLLDEQSWTDRLQAMLVDGMELTDEEAERIIDIGEKRKNGQGKPGSEYTEEELEMLSKYNEAATDADAILDEEVESCIAAEDKFYDEALDNFRDDFSIGDDSGFFDDVGLRYMSDVANSFDLDWPYMMGTGGNGGSRDWDSIGDSLHEVVDMPVKVSSGYHSATRKPGLWIVEPDSSLEPDDREDYGLEIVSPPMPLKQALEKLEAVTDWANGPGNAYTNSSTGLHMGVSIPFKGGNVDYLKLILFLGDEYVLQQFGRESNTYTKAAMKEIRARAGSERNAQAVMELLKNNLIELAERELARSTGEGKYTSAHKQGKYIEFRSAGGDWLAEGDAEPGKLENTMMRYAYAMYLAGRPDLERKEYAKKLYKLVSPEGDTTMALFSQLATGAIDKEQFKKEWARKTLEKEQPASKEPTGQWEIYRDDQGQEEQLEIIDAPNRGAAVDAAYDKYTGVIPFKVRPYDPKSEPAKTSRRAELAKRIVQKPKEEPQQTQQAQDANDVPVWELYDKSTNHVMHTFSNLDRNAASTQARQWLQNMGAEDPATYSERFAVRPKTQAAPAPAPTPAEPTQPAERRGNYEIYNRRYGLSGGLERFHADDEDAAEAYFIRWLDHASGPRQDYGLRPVRQS